MKMKKVYIGATAIIILLLMVIASVFYIKANNKDVEIGRFTKMLAGGNTRAAMLEEEADKAEETNEENLENKDSNEENKNEEEQPSQSEEENKEESENKEEVQEEDEEQAKEEKKQVVKEFEVTPMEMTMYVNASSLNVRLGPDTSYSRIGALSRASEINITGKTDNWYRISYNGKVGYVREDYVSSTKPEPIPEPEYDDSDSSDDSSSSANTSAIGHLIIINSRNNTLRYYVSGSLVGSYRCATGAGGTPTPQGKFSIFEKLENRPYYKAGIPGGAPNNPLGPRWMQFKSGGYAIHGTNVDSSIGNNVSHGCVRMHNEDVIQLYRMVPYGTTVIVKNTSQSDKQIAEGYGIYIE